MVCPVQIALLSDMHRNQNSNVTASQTKFCLGLMCVRALLAPILWSPIGCKVCFS